MARQKFSKTRKPKESMFLGDSKELKKYLLAKKNFLEQMLRKNENEYTQVQIGKIESYVRMINEILNQKYFQYLRVYSMTEMIEEIKLEREDLRIELETMKSELEKAKKMAYEVFYAENSYYANKYEEELYNSPGQVKLRELVDEYQVLEFQYSDFIKSMERRREILRMLLGIIHRPVGFFEKLV